jgi:hypothetical protein
MKLTYGNQTIDLFDKLVPDKIILSLSGGLDSASLFYLICTHFPQVEVVPFTSRDKLAPFDSLCAIDIVQWMKGRFPNAKILDHYMEEFDVSDPELRAYAEKTWESSKVMIDGVLTPRCNTISGLVKIQEKEKHIRNCSRLHRGALVVTAMTKNPPKDIMIEGGFEHLAEKRRTYGSEETAEEWRSIYQPYINVDKKFVAGVYQDNDLMDELYPLTGSCVGTAGETDYFTRECRQCFWCHEKKWAFDLQWD